MVSTTVAGGARGLAGISPDAHPVIDPAYYTDECDVGIVVAGLRIAREIGAAPALTPWCDSEVLPGSDVSGDDLRSYVHVHGIGNLRVADASVMPSPISANTNATVYAIAERAAEPIRSYQRSQGSGTT
jgi:choline dehydrogenase